MLRSRASRRKRWPPSKTELDRLIQDATIDAHGDSEQRLGFYTMLEAHIAMPFDVDILGATATVGRIDMLEDEQIVAICRRGRARQSIPILNLSLPTPPRTAPNGSRPTVGGRTAADGSALRRVRVPTEGVLLLGNLAVPPFKTIAVAV